MKKMIESFKIKKSKPDANKFDSELFTSSMVFETILDTLTFRPVKFENLFQ